MSRQDNIQHQHELERQRQAASRSVPIVRRLVLTLVKNWKRVLLLLGTPSLIDILKEFVRAKLMDQAFEKLGGLGQWLKAYPVAFFTLGLCGAILTILIVVIKESFV